MAVVDENCDYPDIIIILLHQLQTLPSDHAYETVKTDGIAKLATNRDSLLWNDAYIPSNNAVTIIASSNPAYNVIL